MSSESYRKPRANLPIVTCECGQTILIIPDLHEMSRCIEKHATKHAQLEANPEKARLEYTRIEEILTRKVLIKLSGELPEKR